MAIPSDTACAVPDGPRSLERAGFKASHLEFTPGKKAATGGSRGDAPEIGSGVFSFCVAKDDDRQAATKVSASWW